MTERFTKGFMIACSLQAQMRGKGTFYRGGDTVHGEWKNTPKKMPDPDC